MCACASNTYSLIVIYFTAGSHHPKHLYYIFPLPIFNLFIEFFFFIFSMAFDFSSFYFAQTPIELQSFFANLFTYTQTISIPFWFFRLLNPRVVRACTIVLADWKKITSRALKSAVTILHRISFGCKSPAMLYQVSCSFFKINRGQWWSGLGEG